LGGPAREEPLLPELVDGEVDGPSEHGPGPLVAADVGAPAQVRGVEVGHEGVELGPQVLGPGRRERGVDGARVAAAGRALHE